ncbi:hypothetical protein DB763_14260 [Xanthomonas perforans]|nr:hypothetical protein DB761_07445 [Xanthomonas perforans]RXD72713.1 hypothetical protein DB763_14260 [Xanthomonas perforans]RXD83788.1 hypothetical protein DB773_14625 [Xanthomonas perforans]RXD99642.1 hypothetical protein DB770_07620 [Xanthomonas perforans]RXE01735.1 hypothetical protein DB795_07330 [Xanthomonas perforans]
MWIREMWGGRCARLLWGRCRRRRHDRRGHVHDQYGHALEEATHRVESVKFQFSARPMQRDGRTSRKPFSDKKLAHFWLFLRESLPTLQYGFLYDGIQHRKSLAVHLGIPKRTIKFTGGPKHFYGLKRAT